MSDTADLPFDVPHSLTVGSFDLTQDAWGQLVFTDADGRRHEAVTPVRAFPITDPAHYVSICDSRGAELAICEDLAKLPAAVRDLIEADLARRDFIPVIQRIVHITSGLSPTEWTVETDRGATTFLVDSEENVRRLGRQQATITDTHHMRYLIRDVRALDAASRRFLERFLY
ncbi:MAG TPA: DUF1854 domain-containing protein [Pirellulales bacterium]|jgi:hypothetical protein|nr:DUF1854 domain-containing protein [Pirellulales bacterium]